MSKVFNIGFNKAGTTSLHQALKLLGYKAAHFRAYGVGRLEPHIRRNKANGDHLLTGLNFDAYLDFSGEKYFKELDAAYPDSKFILTVRAFDSWIESRRRHVERNQANPRYRGTWLTVDVDAWTTEYTEYPKAVHAHFQGREHQLLQMDICGGDGWDALCPFLDVPIPAEPFPFANASRDDGMV